VLRHIRSRFMLGSVVAGTGGGAVALQTMPMITGGNSYNGVIYGTFTFFPNDTQNVTYYKTGLGFWDYGILDSNIGVCGRQGRALRLAADSLVSWVFGVDENTCLVVIDADTENVRMNVLGQNGVYIFDLRNAWQHTDPDLIYWLFSQITAHYLTDGDIWLQSGSILELAPWKSVIDPHYDSSLTSEDIFSSLVNTKTGAPLNPNEFTKVSTRLFDSHDSSAYGLTNESNPIRYQVTFTKTVSSKGYYGTDHGVSSISYYGVQVDVGYYTSPASNPRSQGLVIGLSIGAVFLLAMIAVPWCISKRNKKRGERILERPSLKGGVNEYLI